MSGERLDVGEVFGTIVEMKRVVTPRGWKTHLCELLQPKEYTYLNQASVDACVSTSASVLHDTHSHTHSHTFSP